MSVVCMAWGFIYIYMYIVMGPIMGFVMLCCYSYDFGVIYMLCYYCNEALLGNVQPLGKRGRELDVVLPYLGKACVGCEHWGKACMGP